MRLKLKHIAAVSYGISFRSRVETASHGNVRLIQMKDLGDNNLVNFSSTVYVYLPNPKDYQLVRCGDILFRSRGQRTTAALLDRDSERTVVAAPLLRVRPDISRVIPEYLLWYINQPVSQTYLASRSEGTVVSMISKKELEKLEVRLPSIERQRAIIRFFKLAEREQLLLNEIKKKKALYAQGILMRIASEPCLAVDKKKSGLSIGMLGPSRICHNIKEEGL